MKACVYTQYGPPEVLQLVEVPKPTPRDNEVLIKVHAASVNFGDLMARDFKAITPRKFNMPFLFWLYAKISFGLQTPKLSIPGSEFSGDIEAVGKAVTRFKPGDPVFGFSMERFGAYAEYLCLPENDVLALKPVNLNYEEAAVLSYGALMAWNLLKKVDIQPGHKVLVNGASGGIGSTAVQIARHFGAEVTGVCGAPRLEFVKGLGADHIIDYTRADFTQNGETYDLILDILGKASFSKVKNSLKPNGILLYASFKMKQLLQMLWTSFAGGRKVLCALVPGSAADLNTVKELIEAGKIKPIIDRVYPFDQIVEAHRYVEQGHKKGNVVITVGIPRE